MPLTADSIVCRTEGLMSTALDSDLIVLNPERDNYIGLDATGRRVWELLAEPAAVTDLCRELKMDYSDDTGAMSQDLLAFLNELNAEGLVRAVNQKDR
jgi:hypothetical protein